MKLIKITTKDNNLIKPYMTEIMSFDKGIIEIIVGYDLAKEMGAISYEVMTSISQRVVRVYLGD